MRKSTCNPDSLKSIFELAQTHNIPFDLTLIHYDFPYSHDGADHEHQFFEEDRGMIVEFVKKALELKKDFPFLILNTEEGISSIPDWLIHKADMRVPCHRYRRLWIGPNGVVRVCQKNCDLGNLNEKPLKDMLHNELHQKASQDCFDLNCTICHVGYDERIQLHARSKNKYRALGQRSADLVGKRESDADKSDKSPTESTR